MKLGIFTALVAVAALSGCASSTQLITNDKPSDEVKAKSFKSYKEVLFVPPKEDKRDVVPRVVKDIEGMGYKVVVADPNKPLEASQGTGFVVGTDGWLLTCAHVLGDQKEATVTLGGQRFLADVTKSDAKADLALLKLREPLPVGTPALSFRKARPGAMGEDVFTIGYPLSRMLGSNARMTKGLLSATTGLRDDETQLQVSAEIQPGNSGGPLLDREGNVLGIVNKTLNPAAVARTTGGALPQNVNFAIKSVPAMNFLQGADAGAYGTLAYDHAVPLDVAARAVARIQAGIVAPDSERVDKMVVRLSYVSMWDMWFRFRVFVIAAFDEETAEPLFVAGQGHDNPMSSEDVVIQATMDQFRKAIATR